MGSAASADITKSIEKASDAELRDALKGLPVEALKTLKEACNPWRIEYGTCTMMKTTDVAKLSDGLAGAMKQCIQLDDREIRAQFFGTPAKEPKGPAPPEEFKDVVFGMETKKADDKMQYFENIMKCDKAMGFWMKDLATLVPDYKDDLDDMGKYMICAMAMKGSYQGPMYFLGSPCSFDGNAYAQWCTMKCKDVEAAKKMIELTKAAGIKQMQEEKGLLGFTIVPPRGVGIPGKVMPDEFGSGKTHKEDDPSTWDMVTVTLVRTFKSVSDFEAFTKNPSTAEFSKQALELVNDASKDFVMFEFNEAQYMAKAAAGEMKRCTATDTSNACVLYVKLKVDYTMNPQVPNKEALVGSLAGIPDVELMPGMGKGVGFTSMWATVPGLRGKFFTYNEETQTCSGVYTFFDKASLDAYMASDLFKQQKDYPHCPEVTATIHQMLAGSERSMDLGSWGGGVKPARADVSKAYVLVAHLHIDFTTNPDVPNKEALFSSLAGIPDVELAPGLGKGMGFTGMWSAVPGLRSKAFTWTDEGNICSGFYVFFDKKCLDDYLASDLGKGQAAYPHVKKFEASVHEVLPGTELSIDLGEWPGK